MGGRAPLCDGCGDCKVCRQRVARRKWYQGLSPERKAEVDAKSRQRGREWRERNPEKVRECGRNYMRRNRRKVMLKFNYGMTVEQYQAMWDAQDGRCAICGNPESKRAANGSILWLSVDHDHDSGAIRGLLCQSCNAAIGLMNDDITTMTSAIRYLQERP